jgi:hypothetical protein
VIYSHIDLDLSMFYDALSHNKNIEHLKIANNTHLPTESNNVEYFNFDCLPKNLKSLDISNIEFTKYQMESLLMGLERNDSITSLDFSFSNFSNFSFLRKMKLKSFKYNMKNYTSMEGNSLESPGKYLINHRTIEEITLMDGSFDLQSMLKNPKLKSLKFNKIREKDLKINLKNVNLEHLSLDGCKIDFTKNFKFLENLFNLPCLKSLNISGNELGIDGAKFIISMLENNHKLERLTVSGNNYFIDK